MFPMDRHGWESFMAARAITRADLSEAVYQEVGLSRRESAELVGSAGARGEAEAITRKSDIADGMSEAGGRADLPRTCPECRFIADFGHFHSDKTFIRQAEKASISWASGHSSDSHELAVPARAAWDGFG